MGGLQAEYDAKREKRLAQGLERLQKEHKRLVDAQ
jgi:hypothetical protein